MKNKGNKFTLTRIYDAPVKAVWAAWADPKEAAKWWGPRGFTITTHGKDLRSGGFWKYTMHGPAGANYENRTIYHEVDEYKRLVYDHGGSEDRPPLFRVTVLFTDLNGKTKLDMTMSTDTEQAAAEMVKFIKQANGNSTWDRLGEYLAEKLERKHVFFINRVFETPIDNMYEMWTKAENFEKWLPPTGFTMAYHDANIRSGGSVSYSMTNGEFTMYGRINYLDVCKYKLIYTQQFCDETFKKVTRHPAAPTWPETMKTTVTLHEEGSRETRVTVKWEIVGNVTAEELDTFIKGRTGMTLGWTGSFDKLEAYLSKK